MHHHLADEVSLERELRLMDLYYMLKFTQYLKDKTLIQSEFRCTPKSLFFPLPNPEQVRLLCKEVQCW